MMIETVNYAPDYIKKMIARAGWKEVKAYAMFRLYEGADVDRYPVLRDRTAEMLVAVKALAGSKDAVEIVKTGGELREYGFEAVGAQFSQKFKIIIA